MHNNLLDKVTCNDFIKFGRMLWESGLIHLTSGNISVRKEKLIFITSTGSLLGDLSDSDIVPINLENDLLDKGASSETPVHRAIYLANPGTQAIVHAHPPYATALSWDYTTIKPIDSDSLYIPEIPILTNCSYGEGSLCVAKELPKMLNKSGIALVRGHGSFAIGKDLKQAATRTSMMENQSRLLFFRKLLER